MRRLTIIALKIGVVFVISACGASEEAIAIAIAETELASNTDTPIPPTDTPVPTDTPQPTPTNTVEPTPTPDVRVYDVDPQDVLLQRGDLPAEGKYYLDYISPHRNSEIQIGFGGGDTSVNNSADATRAYLLETDRVDGWVVYYGRGTSKVSAPIWVYDNPILYATTEGAQMMTIGKYGECAEDYKTLSMPTIGDTSKSCQWTEMQSNGKNYVVIIIEFSSRNIVHNMNIEGYEADVRYDFIEQLALDRLAQLQSLPLADEVTFQP